MRWRPAYLWLLGPMRWRPAHLWLLGPLMFGPSVFIWALSIWIAGFGPGWRSFDAYSIRGLYLPVLAAILGFSVPFFALRACWNAGRKSTFIAMACYWLIMLTWGLIDVRDSQYQIGVHRGAVGDGHRGYSHYYHTWWFIPYYWIER